MFDLLKAKIKLKVAAMKSWERITREDRKHVLEVYSSKNNELGFALALYVSAQTICVTLNALKGTIFLSVLIQLTQIKKNRHIIFNPNVLKQRA